MRNRFVGLRQFIRRWDTGHPAHGGAVRRLRSESGRINREGKAGCTIAQAYTPGDDGFAEALEPDVRPLVLCFIKHLNCITYSSCQGHPEQDGYPPCERHIGVVARSPEEHERLYTVLRDVAHSANRALLTSDIRVEAAEASLAFEDGVTPCIDFVFRCRRGDWRHYFARISPVSEWVRHYIERGGAEMKSEADIFSDWRARMFRGFSMPEAGPDFGFLEGLAVESGRERLSQFLANNSDAIERTLPGFSDSIHRFSGRDLRFDDVWHESMGGGLSLPARGRGNVRHTIQALALHFSQRGLEGDWEIEAPPGERGLTSLRWGRILLPSGARLALSCDGEVPHLVIHRGAERIELALNSQGVLDTETAVRCGLIHWPSFVTGTTEVTVWEESGDVAYASRVASSLASGWELAARCAPDYAVWISQTLRGVVALPSGEGGRLSSHSSADEPGIIGASCPPFPAVAAETLIHECAHQYLHLLCRLGPIEDGTDNTLHFSPFRREPRPLRALVVAYHAFGNVEIFYDRLRRLGMCERDDIAYLESLSDKLKQIEPVLVGSTALTAIGKALFWPLRDRLAEID